MRKKEKLSKEDSELLQRQLDYCNKPADQKYKPYYPKPSKVKRNKNYKTISASNSFDLNQIPITIIASYKVWINLENRFLKNDNFITFKRIESYIYRASKKTKDALKEYCKQKPKDFAWYFYYYYIFPSNAKNPLFKPARKSRGGSPYTISREDMWKIKTASRHLYVFLSHWLKQPKNKYPPELCDYLKRHGITPTDAITITLEIIQNHFNSIFDTKTEDINYYRKYIAYQSLKSLKQAYLGIGYLPIREPLLSILKS